MTPRAHCHHLLSKSLAWDSSAILSSARRSTAAKQSFAAASDEISEECECNCSSPLCKASSRGIMVVTLLRCRIAVRTSEPAVSHASSSKLMPILAASERDEITSSTVDAQINCCSATCTAHSWRASFLSAASPIMNAQLPRCFQLECMVPSDIRYSRCCNAKPLVVH